MKNVCLLKNVKSEINKLDVEMENPKREKRQRMSNL